MTTPAATQKLARRPSVRGDDEEKAGRGSMAISFACGCIHGNVDGRPYSSHTRKSAPVVVALLHGVDHKVCTTVLIHGERRAVAGALSAGRASGRHFRRPDPPQD